MARDEFFDLYRQYTKGQESPEAFHFWSAVSLVCSILGRNVWINRGYYNLYSNHFIILVSKSALARKSTAFARIAIPRVLNEALKLLHGSGLGGGTPKIIAHKMTPESLCQELVLREKNASTQTKMERPIPNPCLLYASELGVFMSKSSQMSGLTDILMDIYDCQAEWRNRTKTSGVDYLYNLAPSLISATTPDWISGNVTTSLFNQGLVGRTIFVYSDRAQTRIAHPIMDDSKRELEQKLIKILQQVSFHYGEFTWSSTAWKYFEDWYNGRSEPTDDSGESGFWGREHEHVLKLAMVMAAVKRDKLILYKSDIEAAIKRLAVVRESIASTFKEVAYAHEDADTKYVEAVIKEAGEIKRSPLLRKVYRRMQQEKLDQCLSILMAAKVIHRFEDKKPKKGPAAIIYGFGGKRGQSK
jgi:hypothetical protein